MNLTWNEACKQVGYVPREECPIVREKQFLAYKDGKCETFTDRTVAEKFSKLIETKYSNQAEHDAWYASRRKLEQEASVIWHASLKDYYMNVEGLSEAVYDLCYSQAYDDGHSAGYDEVANCMIGFVDFAQKIITANRGNSAV